MHDAVEQRLLDRVHALVSCHAAALLLCTERLHVHTRRRSSTAVTSSLPSCGQSSPHSSIKIPTTKKKSAICVAVTFFFFFCDTTCIIHHGWAVGSSYNISFFHVWFSCVVGADHFGCKLSPQLLLVRGMAPPLQQQQY